MKTMTGAELARRRLGLAARRLGTRNPVEAIGGLLDRSFRMPVGDPRYGQNALTPGSFPLEMSFSEMNGGVLRFAMEPLGPDASPDARRHETTREVRRLVHQYYGRDAVDWFDERSEPWRVSTLDPNAQFGAMFGAGFDENGAQELKAYYELSRNQLDCLPPNLLHASRVALSLLPDLVPLGVSVAAGRGQGAMRVYFFHRGDLRLLELEPLMNQLGIGQHLPALLTAVGLVLGGRFVLPEGSVILGLRDTSRGFELKVEVLIPALPDPPDELASLIQMQLGEKPQALRDLRRWVAAMTPDEYDRPGDLSVLSFRVGPRVGLRMSLYFRPVGYDRPPSYERPGPEASTRDPHARDPYAQPPFGLAEERRHG